MKTQLIALIQQIKECSSQIRFCQKRHSNQKTGPKCDAMEMEEVESSCQVTNNDCSSNGKG